MKSLFLALALISTAQAATIELTPPAGVVLVDQCGLAANTNVYVTEFTDRGTLTGYVQAWCVKGTTRYNRRQYMKWWSIEWDLAGNVVAFEVPPYVSLYGGPLQLGDYRAYELTNTNGHVASYLVTP